MCERCEMVGIPEWESAQLHARATAAKVRIVKVEVVQAAETLYRRKPVTVYFDWSDDTIASNLAVSRHERPLRAFKAVWPLAMALAARQLDEQGLKWVADVVRDELKRRKPTFSRKAGCSCGCSPGFKMRDVTGFTVHVEVEAV